MSKRIWTLILVVIIATLSLTAMTPALAEKKNLTLTYMCSQDHVKQAEWDLAAKFEEETGIKIDFQIIPADQFQNMLMTKLNAGECTDLFATQSGKFDIVSKLNVEENCAELTNEEWVDRFDPFTAQEASVDGKLYGVTFYDNTVDYYVVYNRTIFEELGLQIPTTFDEFKAVCEAIKNAGIIPIYECVPDVWHHVMWFCEIGPRYEEIVPGLFDALNSNQTTFSDNPCFAQAMDQINEMAQLGYWGEDYMSNAFVDLAMYMNGGEYAMCLGMPGTINEIVEYDPTVVTADDFGLFKIPVLDNQFLNVHPVAPTNFIWSGSEHIEEAKAYLAFKCRQENLQYIVDNEPRWDNLPFEGLTPTYSDYTIEFMESNQKRGVVLQDSIMYLNPQWMEIGVDMSAMFIGEMDAETIIKNIDDRRVDQAIANNDPNWVK